MPFLDIVGGYPEGPGPEESYRRTVNPTDATRQPRLAAGRSSIPKTPSIAGLTQRRWRLHAAGAGALALVVLLWVAVPARTLRIAADGRTIVTHSRSVDAHAVARNAGIALEAGDRVVQHGQKIDVRRAAEVSLAVDGRVIAARTQAATIDELLAQQSVALSDHDAVTLEGAFVEPSHPLVGAPGSVLSIEVHRALPFSVSEGGQQTSVRSGRATVGAAISDAGITLGPGDAVQPALDTPLNAGLQVHVQRASRLLVTFPEGNAFVYTTAPTIGEALSQSGISLPEQYRLEPSASTAVNAGLAVHVVGVSERQEQETERIQSYVVYQPDPTLPAGTQQVVAGHDGVEHREYSIVSEDGVQVSRDLTNTWYDPEPANTIVYYSTATAPVSASHASSGNWRDLVCSYDWDCNWALAVIQCESGGNPDSYNPAGYVGLFQVWEGYASNLRDPATNIAAAYSLYVSGGRGNWPNCP